MIIVVRVVCCATAVGYACVCVNVDCDGSAQQLKSVTALPELPPSAQKERHDKVAKKAKLYTAAVGKGLQLKDVETGDANELPRQRKRITLKIEEVADAQRLVSSSDEGLAGIVAGQFELVAVGLLFWLTLDA